MFLMIVLWVVGAFLLFWFFTVLMALPRAVGSLVDRKPPVSPMQKFVDEHQRYLNGVRPDRK